MRGRWKLRVAVITAGTTVTLGASATWLKTAGDDGWRRNRIRVDRAGRSPRRNRQASTGSRRPRGMQKPRRRNVDVGDAWGSSPMDSRNPRAQPMQKPRPHRDVRPMGNQDPAPPIKKGLPYPLRASMCPNRRAAARVRASRAVEPPSKRSDEALREALKRAIDPAISSARKSSSRFSARLTDGRAHAASVAARRFARHAPRAARRPWLRPGTRRD